MKKIYLVISTILFSFNICAQTQSQDLNMGLYQLQFPSASGGNNRIQSYGGSSTYGTWLFKSRFDHIKIDAGENSSNGRNIIFKIGGVDKAIINSYGNFGIGTTSPLATLDVYGDIKLKGGNQEFSITSVDETESGYGNFINYGGIAINGNSGSNRQMFMFTDGTSSNNIFSIVSSTDAGSSWYPRFNVAQNGNVGIGTSSPSSVFHISSETSGDAVLKIGADTDNNNEADNARIEILQDGGATGAYIGFNLDWGGSAGVAGAEPDNLFRIGTRYSNSDNYNRLVINTNNGNIGIGTPTPDNKLDVKGTIRAEEVKVETGWADYVFYEDYELKSLSEVSTYIQENRHLPGIPTAQEVAENGIKLGEMNAKLLEKVEELTLYLIEMKEENITQNSLIDTQNQTVERLLNRVEELEKKLED